MNVIFDFNSNWYVLLFVFLAALAILFVVRRKWIAKHVVKQQVFQAFGGMSSLARMDFFAVSTGLWNYTSGN
jgi:hypothetical protein